MKTSWSENPLVSSAARASLVALFVMLVAAGAGFLLPSGRLRDAGAPGRDPAGIRPDRGGERREPGGEQLRGPAIVPVDSRVGTLMEFADYLESNGVTGRNAAKPSTFPDSVSH